MATPVYTAKTEENARRVETYGHQIPKLSELVIGQVQQANYTPFNIGDLQKITEYIIKNDMLLLDELMSYLSRHPEYNVSIQLATNKNAITFEGALNVTRDYMIDLALKPLNSTFLMDPNVPVMVGGGSLNDIKGTSMPNFIQTASLAILRALKSITDINDVPKLAGEDIYNITTSPVVQTTALPENLDVARINPQLNSWFYFYKDEESPKQGELLIPNLGYQFGGSEGDVRYDNKVFASKDCSSILSGWVGASQVFSTSDMEVAFNVTCLGYPPSSCTSDPLCLAVLEVLDPICNGTWQKNVFADDIFTVRHASGGGHTGFITEIATECFMSLSDARSMPEKEGVGYMWLCPYVDTADNWFYFSYKNTKVEINYEDLIERQEVLSASNFLATNEVV